MHSEQVHHAVLGALRKHIGRSSGTTARELVAEVNATARTELINERDLRHIVKALRLLGHHVCAHPSAGYFIAANDAELQETTGFLRDRALASLKQVAAMERVSLPDLFGQLHLPT
jgi:hypothetical protein